MKTLDLHTLNTDWHEAVLQPAPRWGLGIKDGVLFFRGGVCSPPNCIAQDRQGAFVEGLWEADVAELFLANPQTGFYIEFNLGPKGAWWCCAFEAPRVRTNAGPVPLSGVEARSSISETGWDSTLTIPIKSLPAALAFDLGATRGNVTFCLGAPQQYVTLADLGGGEPDFHRPGKWIELDKLLAWSDRLH
jgi:hypothetical protein